MVSLIRNNMQERRQWPATLQVNGGQMNAVIPAHGFVVFEKVR